MKKTVFISGSEREYIEKLNQLGYETLTVTENKSLHFSVSTHADCALFTPDNNTYFVEKGNYKNIVNYLTRGEGNRKKGKYSVIKCISEDIFSPYPDDIKLNCKCFGRYILCNKAHISREISIFAEKNGYELLNCNQGYSACSTIKLNDSAAITDDESVYNALVSVGLDCIKVSKGSVRLKGFDYGFIGGCAGHIAKNKIAFTGNIDTHADADLIKTFLLKHDIDYINLSDSVLTDIGGIITLYSL